jgi:hypothetical protein
MVPGKETFHRQSSESKIHRGTPSLFDQTLTPIRSPKLETEFIHFLIRPVGPQSCASGVLVASQEEDRPTLDLIVHLRFDSPIELALYFFLGERSADEPRDFQITPQGERQRQTICLPAPKFLSRG